MFSLGKLIEGGNSSSVLEPQYLVLPTNREEERIVDVQGADQYMVAVSGDGGVYSWGKNTGSTVQVSRMDVSLSAVTVCV